MKAANNALIVMTLYLMKMMGQALFLSNA